jgi:uncharacterized protein (TIGR02246 family)
MKLLNTLLLALFVSSTNATTAELESDVWINNKTWEMVFNSGDTLALANLYTEDAIIVPPSLEIFNAREEIKQFWADQRVSGTDNFRVQTINLRRHGDVIYQSAIWIATITSNGVATDLDGEMTNIIARQQDGSWKIQLQSWN